MLRPLSFFLSGVQSYRPDDDSGNTPIINAFQEIKINTSFADGVFFAGEQKNAAIYNLNDVTDRKVRLSSKC